jgi:aspartate 1-decarboxylase
MFNAKIHRAVITEANLEYEGSLTIDADLMDAAGILEYEAVHVWNVTRGTRLVTYALGGRRQSGVICANGAAAHDNRPGDVVIIATFVDLDDEAVPRPHGAARGRAQSDRRSRARGSRASAAPGRSPPPAPQPGMSRPGHLDGPHAGDRVAGGVDPC